MSFAKATISSTLQADPEKRFTPNNHAVTTLVLSVENPSMGRQGAPNEPFQIRVTCWRGLADAAAETLRKGDDVVVEGKLILNSYQAQDGVQKKSFEIEASSVSRGKLETLQPVAQAGGSDVPARRAPQQQQPAPAMAAAPAASYGGGMESFSADDLLTDDDIPF